MDSRWYSSSKDKEVRTKELMNYRNAFEDLTGVLNKHFKKKEAVRDYSPGWEHKQIAVNEYNAVLEDILKLINIKE